MWLFLLLLLVGTSGYSYNSSTTSSCNICPSDLHEFQSESTDALDQSFIVTFRRYSPIEEHERQLAKVLAPCLHWKTVPRYNPAMLFPTDFLVVAVNSTRGMEADAACLTRLLASSPGIRSVTPNRPVQRSLASVPERPADSTSDLRRSRGREDGTTLLRKVRDAEQTDDEEEESQHSASCTSSAHRHSDAPPPTLLTHQRRLFEATGKDAPEPKVTEKLGAPSLWQKVCRVCVLAVACHLKLGTSTTADAEEDDIHVSMDIFF